jgi:hypothetical protein
MRLTEGILGKQAERVDDLHSNCFWGAGELGTFVDFCISTHGFLIVSIDRVVVLALSL